MATTSLVKREKKALSVRKRRALWKQFQSQMDYDKLINALAGSSDVRFQHLFSGLTSEFVGSHGKSVQYLCTQFNISFTELAQFYAQAGALDAMMVMSNHAPEIAEDIAEDARSREVSCWKCEGVGKVMVDDNPLVCRECNGAGKIRKVGDTDSRKMVLDALSLSKKSSGVNFNQNFVNWGGQANESFEALMKETSKVVDAEAEVVEEGGSDEETAGSTRSGE